MSDIEEGYIAIIGMAGRFPGANNIEEFWDNLKNGVESITHFSEEELIEAGIEPEIVKQPNYVKAKGMLDEVAGFDAAFFGFSPKEAEITDPQQRLFLECAWTALEDAGYDPKTYPGEIGVYGSMSGSSTYLMKNILMNPAIIETVGDYAITLGNDKDYLCSRVAYKLNLTGPAMTVQTACSSSLVAVAQACQSLLFYQSDMVLAGGVCVSLPNKAGYLYQEGMIMSPDGHCRAFDANAQGIVDGNGVGIVVLKRLAEALADRDHIYAIIKGSHINNDGAAKMNYTAPSVEGQVKVIKEALEIADIEAETITYVEAHGTGTQLGDPIEIAALTQAFDAKEKQYCAIGSVKTNVGHLDTAAGITNLIKASLALKHQLIPPSLHFETPNPKMDLNNSPFYVNSKLQPWQTPGFPRRAGISSFGIGGTNAHVVLEEAPPSKEISKESRRWQLLLLSAKTKTALETATTQLVEHFKQYPALDLADVAYTYQMGRCAFEQRRMLVCQTIDEAVAGLAGASTAFKPLTRVIESKKTPAVVFMFPGQGAQYINMGRELYETEKLFRDQVDYCAEILKPHLDGNLDLRTVLYPARRLEEESAKLIEQTYLSQPTLFVIEYALAQLWMSWGIQPAAMIGHSIGEYVAACLAGVFTLEEALKLVAVRGQLMQSMPPGTMSGVPLAEKETQDLLDEFKKQEEFQKLNAVDQHLDLSVINVSSQTVISGSIKAVEFFTAQLAKDGFECQNLYTSHAFHSSMMEPILEEFLEQVKKVNLQAPKIPYLSNVSGEWMKKPPKPKYFKKHLRQTVRFADGLQDLVTEANYILLEVGPGRTLSTLATQHPDKVAGQVILTSLRHPKDELSDSGFLLNTLGQLWLAGVAVDWKKFYGEEKRHRLPLPTYPFEHRRYWLEPAKSDKKSLSKKKAIADWFYIPSWQRSTLPQSFSTQMPKQCWLIFLDECGLGAQIVARLEQAGQDVITVSVGQAFTADNDHAYQLNPAQPTDYENLLAALHTQNQIPTMIVHLWRVSADESNDSVLEHLDELQNLGFYSLLFLAQAIGKQNLSETIQIAVVSNNMQAVVGEKWLSPEKATLLGAVKVIPQEYTNINCCSIDVIWPDSETQNDQLLNQLWQAFTTKFTDIAVAYRDNYRWIPTFEPVQLEKTADKISQLREQGVYLIIGGLGAIGLTLAEYLAKTVQARLILVGRSDFPVKQEWAQWLSSHPEDDKVSQKIKKLQFFENEGAQVLVCCADVAEQEQMQTVITQAEEQFGSINGVIHTAGVIDFAGVIHKRSRAITETTMAAKVKGTLVLAHLLQDIELDFLVLGSSIGAIFYQAKFGQVGYAAASDFLDAFAFYKQSKGGTFTVTIDWSDWQEIGMSVEAEQQWRKTHHVTEKMVPHQNTLLPTQGVDIFQRILAQTFPRVIVSPQDLLAIIEQGDLAQGTFINPLEEAELPQSTKHPRAELRQAYIAPQNEQEQMLADIWQQFLGIEPVGIDDDFFELGGDSLLATQIIAKINKTLQSHLSSSSLLESPTIAQLLELIKETDYSTTQTLHSSLVQLQRGNPTKKPLFLVHPVGGTVFHFRELVRHLSDEQPVYGLQSQGLDGTTAPLTKIEEMATHYIKALRTVQPNGPYLIGGYSFGGSVAFEMAQQLGTQQVALLFLIDVVSPEQMQQVLVKFKFDLKTPVLAFMMEEGANFTNWLNKLNKFQTDAERMQYFLQHNKTLPDKLEISNVQRIINIITANFQAMLTYTPQPYSGDIVLFKAKERGLFNPPNPELSWGKIINGKIDTHEISGDHFTINLSPNVELMLAQLKTYL